ncbi:hypothetical protein SDC9_202324 [bioreactor metagenome]|uniref:Uncharacterized protein n=1 Tax=bioreactor metagenome TaxID=1076179 RepID=A0A645IUX7_9ZZZZ
MQLIIRVRIFVDHHFGYLGKVSLRNAQLARKTDRAAQQPAQHIALVDI